MMLAPVVLMLLIPRMMKNLDPESQKVCSVCLNIKRVGELNYNTHIVYQELCMVLLKAVILGL